MTPRKRVSQDFSTARLGGLFELDHPGVVWRHDVDFDLDCALQMAAFEQDFGIGSTYYLRAYPEVYGVTMDELVRVGKEIQSWGHDLALHCDLKASRNCEVTDHEMIAACSEQAARLIHLRVFSKVSFHAPPLCVRWRDIPGFDHSLSPEWCGKYVSDSRGVFQTSPEEMLTTLEKVLVNLHPLWWFTPEPKRSELRKREALAP